MPCVRDVTVVRAPKTNFVELQRTKEVTDFLFRSITEDNQSID